MLLTDADQLRKALAIAMRERDELHAFSKELESNVRRLARERDEARAAFAGAENSLTAEREHSARLQRECEERHDELRKYAEERNDEANKLQRLLNMAAHERDEARAEVERLRDGAECHAARPGEGTYECSFERKCPACRLRHAEAALRTVAERQREACSDEVYSCKNAQWLAEVAKVVRATPLVTEGEP